MNSIMITESDVADLIKRLHDEIAKLNPKSSVWKLDAEIDFADFLDLATLSKTWDPESRALLDEKVYDQALQLVGAKDKDRNRIKGLYYAIARKVAEQTRLTPEQLAARGTKLADATRVLRATNPPVDSTMPSELAAIRSESDFMEYLRVLKSRGGRGLRGIAADMAKILPTMSIGRSTLSDLFRRDVVPTDEMLMEVLLQVLLGALPSATDTVASKVLDQHLTVWRRLLHARNTNKPDDPLSDVLLALEKAERAASSEEAAGLRSARKIVEAIGARKGAVEAASLTATG